MGAAMFQGVEVCNQLHWPAAFILGCAVLGVAVIFGILIWKGIP